jgi:heat-inducible transcriptional repressor
LENLLGDYLQKDLGRVFPRKRQNQWCLHQPILLRTKQPLTSFSTRARLLLIMTEGLTARQTQILKALIDEYIETAQPVGSENLDKKYNLGVSPATIRSEMVSLTHAGYLRQPYTSAGRVPSPQAMKFYIDQLMEEKQMSLADEVKTKEEVWDARGNLDKLLEEATHALAERTKNLAIAATDEGKNWQAGYPFIFHYPEFANLQTCADLFSFLEEAERLQELFFIKSQIESPIDVLFGEDIGWPELSPIGVVATHFQVGERKGALGVIGPVRLSYQTIIPTLRYFRKLIEEVATR